ncbi:MAG: hypothetical protein KGH89_07105 [Thaumarchaeota archaeon]|nr:hypothetical protein [Nitrososphaerota archaeon]
MAIKEIIADSLSDDLLSISEISPAFGTRSFSSVGVLSRFIVLNKLDNYRFLRVNWIQTCKGLNLTDF